MKLPSDLFKKRFEKKTALLSLRFLLLIVLGGMVYVESGLGGVKILDWVFFGLFAAWIFAAFFIPPSWFKKELFLGVCFVGDVLLSLVLLRNLSSANSDLLLIYFITMFFGIMARTLVGCIGASALAILTYSLYHYARSGDFVLFDPAQLIYLPILFVTSMLAGFMADESHREKEEESKYNDVAAILAEKVDLATQKLLDSIHNMKAMLEYHKRILSSVQTGIIVVHQDGKIRTFNDYASQITGFLQETLEGQTLEAVPASLAPIVHVIGKTMAEGRSYNLEDMEITTSRGEKIPISIQTSVMRAAEGPIMGTIVTFRDVSLLRQMETQLARAERLSALGEMAAGVAHEIKNPLNAIQGFSQRLANKVDDPNLKKYAETIVREVQRLDTIINDVLEYSRTAKPVKQPTDLPALLEEVLLYATEKFEKAGIHIVRNFDPQFPHVYLDANKIKQVILNMVLNALYAMSHGGTLTLGTSVRQGMKDGGNEKTGEWVEHVFLNQKMAVLTIQDTGCGIPKENIPKLFHPFFTTKTIGTGLGLSICYKIIEAHGGSITVDSTEGVGTTFMIQFPLDD